MELPHVSNALAAEFDTLTTRIAQETQKSTYMYQTHQTLKGVKLIIDPFSNSADHFLWYCMLKTDFNLFISPSIIDTSSKNFLK